MKVGLGIDQLMKTLRAVVDGRYQEQLETLGRLLGHTSISQTINYVLDGHLITELRTAEKYRQERENQS